MPTKLALILANVTKIAKKKSQEEVVCPICGERHAFIKHGFYWRYLFYDEERIKIQRYKCLNPKCPRRTFSILPHPFLPIIRFPLCFLMLLLSSFEEQNLQIQSVARSCGRSWQTISRALKTASRLKQWLASEGNVSSWGPWPCLKVPQQWRRFANDLSVAFYPARF